MQIPCLLLCVCSGTGGGSSKAFLRRKERRHRPGGSFRHLRTDLTPFPAFLWGPSQRLSFGQGASWCRFPVRVGSGEKRPQNSWFWHSPWTSRLISQGLGFLTHTWGCFEDLGSWPKWRAPSLPSVQQCRALLSNDYEEQERGFDHIFSRSHPLIYISTEGASWWGRDRTPD